MGCGDRYDEDSYSGNSSSEYELQKQAQKYKEDQQMTPVRQWLCDQLPVKMLSLEEYEKLLSKVLLGQLITREEQIKIFVYNYSEKYKENEFNKKRLHIGDVVLLRQGYDEFAFIVQEVYFDGTYKVTGYNTKEQRVSGETLVISHYKEVLQYAVKKAA